MNAWMKGRATTLLAAALALCAVPGCRRAQATPEGERHGGTTAPAEDEARIAPAMDVNVPDEELVDQDGHAVRLRDLFADRVVAVNFVFTTCTTICSPMTAIFGRLQQQLGPALETRVRLISISLDPATDTPDKLRAYADRFGRRPGWTFLTGPSERVARVLRALGGQAFVREEHRPLTLLGSSSKRRWQRVDGIASSDRLAAWIRPLVGE
ncbi:Cytochrome oxidase biogenesis protein Sco1/SenC/PrrC, putative copper metallochaperone [Minicystis rosea]|nr:Cytochrome oxidase biogenesis protein Sco1/SenC/PrrC, putative copper metallochaperone [Minicystis rosea]